MLGPCVGSADAAQLLFADARYRLAGQHVFIDVPSTNPAAVALVETLGLTVQRHLTRMCRGVPVVERVELLWGSSGPEVG